MKPVRRSVCPVIALLLLLSPATAQESVRPQFRAGVTMVPVPVRVADRQGNPVTDLSAADFEVFENGVPQEIAQLSTKAYVTNVASPPRTFVILLGFGNHEPSNAIRILINFVRSGLRSSDRLSVIAYLRGLEPTTDHEAVARLLERYRSRYQGIEGKLKRDRRRPMLPLSADTRAALDNGVFEPAGSLQVHEFPNAAGGKGLGYASDVLFCIRAIDFVRHLEGDKHLIWLLSERVLLPKDGVSRFARMAAAARASVSLITTGGSEAAQGLRKGRVTQLYVET